jgi:hypothetical protein
MEKGTEYISILISRFLIFEEINLNLANVYESYAIDKGGAFKLSEALSKIA